MFFYVSFMIPLLGISSAGLLDYFRPDNWNDLKVKWGPIPFGYFNSMPHTVDEAAEEGFVKIGDCNTTSNFRGVPYMKDGDKSLILLYDVNGYIAGIQTVVPYGLPHDYPSRGLTPPFIKLDDGFYLTAYLVPPASICSTGRSRKEFKDQGMGSVLLIQTGLNPERDYLNVPLKEKDLARTRWVKGKCFPTMGVHYWYDISVNMNCDQFFPVFLLYNDDELNGFGWAVGADLTSSRWEHPKSSLFGLFLKEPPLCLYDRGKLSTMHVFLTSRPILNFC